MARKPSPAFLAKCVAYSSQARKIERLRKIAGQEWSLACRHDGIDENATFSVFSKGNPHAIAHGGAMANLRAELNK